MSWLRITGFIIWALVELFRWLERNKMKTELTHDWLTKLEQALKEIEDDVQRANTAVTPTDVLLADPNNRDNDKPTETKGP